MTQTNIDRSTAGTVTGAGLTSDAGTHAAGTHSVDPAPRRLSTETKASFKTTELIAYLAGVIAVIIVSLVVKTTSTHVDYFRADKAMFYIVLLTIGYLASRGVAKSGSRDDYNA